MNDIYDAYKGKDAKGHLLDDERAIRRYFEPSLAALMVKDQKIAAKRGEVGLLDFDPFIDAQDWEISAFDIAVYYTAPGKTTATVKFTNFDKAATVRLDLVKIKNDWRIDRPRLRAATAHSHYTDNGIRYAVVSEPAVNCAGECQLSAVTTGF